MSTPRDIIGASLRFRVEPRDVPPSKAARRLHLTLAEFNRMLPQLYARGFPKPDATTGHYDLKAIEAWQDTRSGLSTPPTGDPTPCDARVGFEERVTRLLNGQG